MAIRACLDTGDEEDMAALVQPYVDRVLVEQVLPQLYAEMTAEYGLCWRDRPGVAERLREAIAEGAARLQAQMIAMLRHAVSDDDLGPSTVRH